MSDPYVGEIRMWSFDWAAKGWALCNGALLPITQNQALYSLLGTAFGGDGRTTFGIPDLRGRVPTGAQNYGSGSSGFGAQGGAETVTLTTATVPSHLHTVAGTTTSGNSLLPAGGLLATIAPVSSGAEPFSAYAPSLASGAVALDANTVQTVGGNQGHNNVQPFTVVNFAICTSGTYPPRP